MAKPLVKIKVILKYTSDYTNSMNNLTISTLYTLLHNLSLKIQHNILKWTNPNENCRRMIKKGFEEGKKTFNQSSNWNTASHKTEGKYLKSCWT